MHAGSLWSCPTLCDPVDCGLLGFSVREGVLQARIPEHIGQCWVPYPSRALYFLQLPTPLSPSLVLPEPLGPKQPHTSTPEPSPGQTQVLQGSLRSKPQWTTLHAEVEIKPQLKPRGSVTKEVDPKPFHQMYNLQIKFT